MTLRTQTQPKYESIAVEPLTSSIGARLHGVDIATGVSEAQLAEIRQAIVDHLVVFLPEQQIDDDAQIEFARSFGEPHPHPVSEYLGNTDLVNRIDERIWRPEIDADFHTDYSFHTDLPEFAILRAVIVPSHGGDTIWSSMYEAYEALSPTMQHLLEGLEVLHDQGSTYSKLSAEHRSREETDRVDAAFAGTVHPLVCVHPASGRKYLFVNRSFARRVVGLHRRESDALLRFLFDHVDQARFTCRYHWSVGDVAIWDERVTLHQAEASYWPERRQLHRVTAGSSAPRAAVVGTT